MAAPFEVDIAIVPVSSPIDLFSYRADDLAAIRAVVPAAVMSAAEASPVWILSPLNTADDLPIAVPLTVTLPLPETIAPLVPPLVVWAGMIDAVSSAHST
jgi:hypothetical protein